VERQYDSDQTPRWLISITVMLTTIMVILDMTIVNVSLPHMMGSLETNRDQITWVLTSYIAAQAVTIPLTGYLSGRFGRRTVMLVSVAGFVAASALCGTAETLSEMVIFRIAQGIFGASLIPLSQSVLVDTFPKGERGKAMALWGVGIMVGPVLGPTLGGYITQHLTWRWVFYINVPVGMLNLWMISRLVRQTPKQPVHTDWLGLLLLAMGIASLQIVLDRGNQEGWFSSQLILILTFSGALSLLVFVLRGWNRPGNIVNLTLLKDRNLASASIMMAAFGLSLFGTIAMQPIMLERLLNYPAETTGLVMAPRGIGTAASMLLVSRLINRFDIRLLIGGGLILAAAGTYLMTWYDLYIDPAWVIWPGVLQGFGMGLVMVPLSTAAFETLPKAATDAGSGIFNVFRTIGGSIGISIASTLLARDTQSSWNQLGGFINPFNPAVKEWLKHQGLPPSGPASPQVLAQELYRQASMVAFDHVFWIITLSFLAMAPLLLLMRQPKEQRTPPSGTPPE
jgi:DHA2 family multidrug resistance protein